MQKPDNLAVGGGGLGGDVMKVPIGPERGKAESADI